MTSVTRRYRFSASHRLHSPQLSETENVRLYGKCNHPFGHGHDYVVEVSAAGPVDSVTGLVLPTAKLDRLVEQNVVRLFANRNINLDVPEFAATVPTTENIAYYIVRLLQQHWSEYVSDRRVRLSRVHVQETDRNGFSIQIATSATNLSVGSSEKAQRARMRGRQTMEELARPSGGALDSATVLREFLRNPCPCIRRN